jgi:nucleoside-diphosphate-sugar epimerase
MAAYSLDGRRVLITGGAGFVGSHLVRAALADGAVVTVLDDLSTGDAKEVEGLECRLVKGSILDRALVSECVKAAEVVIHAAARNIIVSTRNPLDDFETNIGGTLNVLLAAREAGIQRVVYTSSASIYGNSRYLPVNEDDVPNLLSPYAVSKYSGESYCRAFYESYDLPTAVVRYSNVYGPGQAPSNPYCGVIGKFFAAARSGRAIEIHGDGQQTRDFTYVDDAVAATLIAAVHPRAVGQVFNVGTGFETAVNTLAETVKRVAASDVPVRHVDRRDIDNIRRRVLNIEKIRQTLHWVPGFTLEQGLARMWKWFAGTEGTTTSAPQG